MARSIRNNQNPEDIRKKINAQIGRNPLNEREWYLLVKNGFIEDIQHREGPISPAVEYIRDIRWSREPPDELQKSDVPQLLSKEDAKTHLERSFALSLLLFEEASRDTEVRAFRTEVLADTLLDREMVPEWIQQQAKVDGKPTMWLKEIPISSEYKGEVFNWISNQQVRQPLKIELPASSLRYSVGSHLLMYGGSDEWAYAVPTCIDGVLERLRNLSERLAGEYGWQEAQATLFVLTGKVPFIDPIHVRHEMESGSLYLRQRIVLDVDTSVSPNEIAKRYRQERKGVKTRPTGKLSEKHLRLATFEAERPREESWAKKLAEWNRNERPEWGYSNDRRRFAHDCLQARRRILGSPGGKFEIQIENRLRRETHSKPGQASQHRGLYYSP